MSLANRQYSRGLDDLRHAYHNRNNRLVSLMVSGLISNHDREKIKKDVIDAGGEPRLTDQEVERAMQAAERFLRRIRGHHYNAPPRPTFTEMNFVRKMINEGRHITEPLIRAAAKLEATESDPIAAAQRQIASLRLLDDNLIWLASDLRLRSKNNLYSVASLLKLNFASLGTVPNFICPNPFTGEMGLTKGGDPSLICDNSIKTSRYIVLEFDMLSLEEQLEFLAGVIKTGSLKVVSAVYSGSKSVHVLVEVEGEYAEFKNRLKRLVVSSPRKEEMADLAPMHPSSPTRLAGAIRPETGNVQRLIYAAYGKRM